MSNYLEPAHHKDWKSNNYLKISGFFSDEEVTALQAWVKDIEVGNRPMTSGCITLKPRQTGLGFPDRKISCRTT